MNIRENAVQNLVEKIIIELNKAKEIYDRNGIGSQLPQKIMYIMYMGLDIKEVATKSANESVEKILSKIEKLGSVSDLEIGMDLCGSCIVSGKKVIINTQVYGGYNIQIPHYRTTFKKIK